MTAETLRQGQILQARFGAGTKIMSPAEIAADYPFYNVDGIICGSHNLVDEGYFDSGTMFELSQLFTRSGWLALRSSKISISILWSAVANGVK